LMEVSVYEPANTENVGSVSDPPHADKTMAATMSSERVMVL
jgi:hypothetical protein